MAQKAHQEEKAEQVRKQEFLLRSFNDYRLSVSQGRKSGSRLYTKGVKKIESRERNLMAIKLSNQQASLDQCTFKPVRIAKQMPAHKDDGRPQISSASNDDKDALRNKHLHQLYALGAIKQQKLEEKKVIKEEQEVKSCNFRPEIN